MKFRTLGARAAIKSRDEKSRVLLHPAVTHEHCMTSSIHYTSLSDIDFDVSTTKKSPFVGGIITAVVVVIVVVVAVPVAVIYGKNGSTTMCLSAECIKLSSSVRAALDQTVDPCTDFYNFSCGNWIKNTTIPSGEFMPLSTCVHDEFLIPRCAVVTSSPELRWHTDNLSQL